MANVPAAVNALRILTLLSSIDVPISAARIRAELDLPRSSTYHLLKVMEEAGFVVRIPGEHTFGLGLVAYSMANAYTEQQPLVRAGAKLIEKAARIVSGSGHISRMSGSEIVYLHEVRAPGAVSLVTEVGVRLSAARTASGRSMLAHLPDAEARAVFATAPTEDMTLREFRAELEKIRGRGWADEVEEVSRGQETIAVAVLDHLDRPAAALAVTFRVGTVTSDQRDELRVALTKGSLQLSKRMYGLRSGLRG